MEDLTLYILIPFLTAGIGWSTNWLGIKMMIYPTNFVGFGKYIGWQGILPRVRVRMTRAMVENSISKICTPRDMLEAVDDARAIEAIAEQIEPQIEDWADAYLKDRISSYWRLAPSFAKQAVYAEVHRQVPKYAEAVLEELKGRLGHLIDVAEIAAIEAEARPEIFPNMMKTIARAEFNFVIWSGLYIGFPLGCVQAAAWYFFPNDWVLPIFGAFVGGFTNWLALQALVHPSEPIKFFGLKIQGIFIARQPTVSVDFAETFTRDFVDMETLFDYIWHGENKEEVRGLVRRQINRVLSEKVLTGPIYRVMVLAGQGEAVDQEAIKLIDDKIDMVLKRSSVSEKLLVPIRDLIAERMAQLSPKEFQNLLMPIFEEDQWLLVAVGTGLGFFAGVAQLVYLFGGQFF